MNPADFAIVRRMIGLTLQELADRLGVQLRTVQRWENGSSPINEGVQSEMQGLRDEHFRLTADLTMEASAGSVVVIPRDGWYAAAAVRVLSQNPEARFEWKD